MEKTKRIYLGGGRALAHAEEAKIELRPSAYFITEHQYQLFEKAQKTESTTKCSRYLYRWN
jgi:hypothetical protein